MADDPDESDDWKYAIDEVGDDATDREEDLRRIEPGSPSGENTLFVLVGVALALLVIARGLGVI